MSVCVIGAGVIGLPTAVYLQEQEPRAKVTLIAENFSSDTTSDIAAGLWRPYYMSDPRTDLLKRWAESTYDYIDSLYREDSAKYGAGRVSGYELNERREEDPYWAECVPDFRHMTARELDRLGWGQFKDGFFYTSVYLECKKYLPIMLERFRSNGGIVQKRKLNSLNELEGMADVIVNCSGLASYHLVNDKTLYPIRGQVFKVRAPFIKHFVTTEDHYILLNHDVITLGGTHQEGNWSTEIDSKDSRDIWEGTTALMPSVKQSTILGEYVALRPGRPTVRLEAENTRL